jgi:anthranilate/para-aminobenzoate synthase component I
MTTQSAQLPASLERTLLDVVRALPSGRVLQVLDFARWLQTQLAPDEEAGGNTAQAAMEQEEKAWEQTYNANRDDFRAMARQALADLDAGETLEMVIANGKVKAR